MALLNVMVWAARRPTRLSGLLFCLGAVLAPVTQAQTLPHEREVQTVFLLNLTRFAHWPAAAFSAEGDPLFIGVLADDPLAPLLTAAAEGEKVGQHPLRIRRIDTVADLEGCHLVYFGRDALDAAIPMIARLENRPVLMVSDAEGFLRLGGHIQLFKRAGQIRLRVQLDNIKATGITLSAQFLRVAELAGK